MRIMLFALVIDVIFTVFVTAFAASADKRTVRNLPKALWVILCLVASPIGGLAYLIYGRPVAGSRGRNTTEYLKNLADRLRDNRDD
ncbi:MAG: hypothetical protein RLZZ164_806 [Actinomycetota bacterium]|jgi:ABC-type amino acid transport system permease subunit